METTKLSSKGRIVLPKAVREAHRWQPGTEFTVEDTGDGILLRPARAIAPTRIEDVAGRLRVDGPVRTSEEMGAAIDAEVKERGGRGRY